MKLFYLALTIILFLTACSSNIDPDIAFKGEIDDTFLTALSRGETSITLNRVPNECYEFIKPVVEGNVVGEWEKSATLCSPALILDLYISQGCAWNEYLFDQTDHRHRLDFESEINCAWIEYKSKTGFNKKEYIKCHFKYEAQSKKIMIDDLWFNVESATENKFVLSHESNSYVYKDDKNIVSNVVKEIYSYCKGSENADELVGEAITYESRKEVLIAHIRMMKEYGGDIWTLSWGGSIPRINLSLIEEIIASDKTYSSLSNRDLEEIFGIAR